MALKTSLYLRRADRDDLDLIVEWTEDPDFIHFLYGDRARSPRQVREQIVGMLGRSPGSTMPGGIHLLMDSDELGLIGLISLQNISWRNRSCNVDVYLGDKKHRSGFLVYVSVYRAFEYCFDELNMHRVGAYIYAFNTPSWRLLERTGAVRELVMREHVLRDGKLYDLYGYGLLRSEFEKFREGFETKFRGMSLTSMIAERESRANLDGLTQHPESGFRVSGLGSRVQESGSSDQGLGSRDRSPEAGALSDPKPQTPDPRPHIPDPKPETPNAANEH